MSDKKQIILADQPTTFPSFPHAVKAGGLVFLSGMRSNQNPASHRQFSDIPKPGRDKKQDFLVADHMESRLASWQERPYGGCVARCRPGVW